MLSTSTWALIIFLLAVIGAFIPDDEVARDYDCYDKSPYKCGNCNKDCKCRDIVLKHEELEKKWNRKK